MSLTTRRDFLARAAGGAVALAAPTRLFGSGQVPGHVEKGVAAASDHAFARVMAIAAHPGDAFFAMGAPVALATHVGGQGWFLSLSLGEKGSPKIPLDKYGAAQHQAAEKAAALLRAKALFLPYPDAEIPINDEAKFAVCDLIRDYKPATIVTHWKGSWHKDHRACHSIVEDAIFYAGLSTISRKDPAHVVSKLYFADNWEDADGFVPDTYLDITAVFDEWVSTCSLFPMWRGENGFRYNDYYTSLAILRGCTSDFQRAVSLMSPPEQKRQLVRVP
jgi:N-acetylglucosamine malate deacetylase 1